jgi:predicted S18 family serine protease
MDFSYYFEKLHEGTNKTSAQQDKAALAKALVPEIREQLDEFKKKLAGKGTKSNDHESAIAQAKQHLNDLEAYYDSIESGKRKTLTADTARKYINFVQDEMAALEELV